MACPRSADGFPSLTAGIDFAALVGEPTVEQLRHEPDRPTLAPLCSVRARIDPWQAPYAGAVACTPVNQRSAASAVKRRGCASSTGRTANR